jgi:hypothetical protein
VSVNDINWLSSSLNDGKSAHNVISSLCNAIFEALEMIHQQCYCVLLVSASLIFLWVFDLYFDQLVMYVDTTCGIRCGYLGVFRGWQYLVAKQCAIYVSYLLVVITSVFVWRKRVRKVIDKYPLLAAYVRSENTMMSSGALATAVGSTDTLVLDPVTPESEDAHCRPLDDDELEQERRLILNGHISSNWANVKHLTYFAFTLVYVLWTLMTQSVSTYNNKQ